MRALDRQGIKSNFLSLVHSEIDNGSVHSVFNNSFNLQFEEQLIHIGKLEEGISAFGFTLPAALVDELISAIEVNNRVMWREELMTIYTRKKIFKIDLSALEEYDCRIPVVQSFSKRLIDKFHELPFSEKTDLLVSEYNCALIDLFIDSSLTDENFHKTFIQHFIGRGNGLTPSGDDMLMGILMAEKAKGGNAIWTSLLQEQLLRRATTDVSLAYYHALFEGYTSSHFADLLRAVSENDFSQWDSLIEKISQYGHTSGWDTLFGLFLYVENKKGVMCK